jgi:hypothetical protein
MAAVRRGDKARGSRMGRGGAKVTEGGGGGCLAADVGVRLHGPRRPRDHLNPPPHTHAHGNLSAGSRGPGSGGGEFSTRGRGEYLVGLEAHGSNTGQTPVRHGPNTGQARVKHWSKTCQTMVKRWSNTLAGWRREGAARLYSIRSPLASLGGRGGQPKGRIQRTRASTPSSAAPPSPPYTHAQAA